MLVIVLVYMVVDWFALLRCGCGYGLLQRSFVKFGCWWFGMFAVYLSCSEEFVFGLWVIVYCVLLGLV